MKLYESIAIASLLVASFALGVVSRINNINLALSATAITLAFLVAVTLTRVYPSIEARNIRDVSKRVLIMGRGIPASFVRRQILLLELSVIGVIVVAVYIMLVTSVGRFDPALLLAVTIPSATLAVSMVMLKLRVRFTISFRKTSVEVELPFLLSLMWALSESHITLYDLFTVIERSASLKAWSREMSFAKKFAAVTNMSMMQALATISVTHPSPTVRDIFKRIVSVGYVTGSARNVVRKAFKYTYGHLQDRLSRLTERLDILNGAILFGFLFLPIILATVSPLTGQGAVEVFFLTIVVEVPISLLMYAFISHTYPSGFAVATPKTLTAVAVASALVFIGSIIAYSLPALTQQQSGLDMLRPVAPGIPETLLFAIAVASLTPPAVLSEMWLRRVRAYSSLAKLIADSVETSISTGENFLTTLERMSQRESKGVQRLVKIMVDGYRSEVFRRAIVVSAPSLYYSTFIETTMFSLLIGANPRVLSTVVNSFESMGRIMERISKVGRTLETLIVTLSATLGFFTKYLERIFSGFVEMLTSMGREFHMARAVFTVFQFNPSVYIAITATSLIAVLSVSLFVGKTRGGSLVYGFRTALMSVACFAMTSMLVSVFAPSLV